jgi:hypothetical protein
MYNITNKRARRVFTTYTPTHTHGNQRKQNDAKKPLAACQWHCHWQWQLAKPEKSQLEVQRHIECVKSTETLHNRAKTLNRGSAKDGH